MKKNNLIQHKDGFLREDKQDKIDYTLIPLDVLHALAKHYTDGATKHGRDNWKKNTDMSSFERSAYRHFISLLNGDQDEDHYSALVWNINCLKWNSLNEE